MNQTTNQRNIGATTATGVVVANMVGAGIFTTTGFMAANLPGPGWVLACWAAGGLIALAGALCYMELATRMPVVGGEYAFLTKLYHPSLGFLTGWTTLIVGFSAPIAASALGFAFYFTAGVVGPSAQQGFWAAPWVTRGIAVAVILLFTGVHSVGVRLGSGVQNTLTALNVMLILALAGAGSLVAGNGHVVAVPVAGDTGGRMALGTAMLLVMFAYSGWNASAYIAGEVKCPRRTLPVSLVLGTGIVIVLCLGVNFFVVRAVPFAELTGNATAAETAAVGVFGAGAGRLLSGLVGFALLSSLSAFVMIGPRVYNAMSRDGLFFRFARRLHPEYGVPNRSIALQGLLAAGMVLVGGLEQLLVFLGFALGIFPLFAVAGLFLARRRGIGDAQAVRTPGYPWVPAFFLASNFTLLVVAFCNRPLESSTALIAVLLGIPSYLLWTRRTPVT
jgi:APA family basic amino acid/polyamine antiporter